MLIAAGQFRDNFLAVDLHVVSFRRAADDRQGTVLVGGIEALDFDHVVTANLPVYLLDRAVQQQRAALDDADRRAAIRQFGKNMAGDQDSFSHLSEFFQEGFDLQASAGVEPAGRLVQDQDRRIMHQRFGQAQALLHAAGEAIDKIIPLVGQVQQFQDIANHLLPFRLGDLVSDGKEIEKFPDFHTVVDPEVVRHVAHTTADAERVARDAVPVNDSFPLGGS